MSVSCVCKEGNERVFSECSLAGCVCVSLCVVGYRGVSAESATVTLREQRVGHNRRARSWRKRTPGGERCPGEETVPFKTLDGALPKNSERRGLQKMKCVPVIEEIVD